MQFGVVSVGGVDLVLGVSYVDWLGQRKSLFKYHASVVLVLVVG